MKSLVEQGDRDAVRLCQKAVDSPRRLLNGVGTKANFRKFAEGMIDWAEKAQQVSDLAGSDDGTRARMRTLFHKHILDAETLPKLLRQEYLVLQLHLIADTVRICQSAGVSDADIERTFNVWKIKDGAWANSYDGLIDKACRIAKSDWLREAMELVASEVAAGAVEGIARGVGLWNVEEGSWLDAMAGLATHLIVDQVIAEATDPAGDVADVLHNDFQTITRRILDGRNGFVDMCSALRDHHIQGRHKLLGIPMKGVK